MVTTFADAPFTLRELETLLVEGGNFVWAAGPLAKGSNLCLGTGGNGYAFLKLYKRTNDPVWLACAGAFAMTAIAECRAKRAEVGPAVTRCGRVTSALRSICRTACAPSRGFRRWTCSDPFAFVAIFARLADRRPGASGIPEN
jgi:hypothetical protein